MTRKNNRVTGRGITRELIEALQDYDPGTGSPMDNVPEYMTNPDNRFFDFIERWMTKYVKSMPPQQVRIEVYKGLPDVTRLPRGIAVTIIDKDYRPFGRDTWTRQDKDILKETAGGRYT